MRYRTVSVDVAGDELVGVTKLGAAAIDAGVLTTYRWSSDGEIGLPAGFRQVTWFGLGPGQAYPDSRAAGRAGRYTSTIEDLQVPYLSPQENGTRSEVCWAELSRPAGNLTLTGDPHLALR
ncbi:beta galactosidase small subunit [Kribbella antiqua]|uniref:beta-galactosidase n=1 Tax=Kribbella antiqua TaxID=2512217 RepID=A0A4V2S3I4_9ACTN|nr:hypothetical protein [Kribbella antiqua]TCO44560.1 beta galactosidase small subunit [Kribbella antiqua]